MHKRLEGPFVQAFEDDPRGIIKQELITYRVRDGVLRKETVTRKYNSDQTDWYDCTDSEPLIKVSKE